MDAQSERDYGFLEGAYEQTVRDYEAVCRRNEELKADRDRLAAELTACRRVLAHLDADLLDSLAIALAEDGDNNHALQLAAAARELRALDKEE